jgi:hypothetical protein
MPNISTLLHHPHRHRSLPGTPSKHVSSDHVSRNGASGDNRCLHAHRACSSITRSGAMVRPRVALSSLHSPQSLRTLSTTASCWLSTWLVELHFLHGRLFAGLGLLWLDWCILWSELVEVDSVLLLRIRFSAYFFLFCRGLDGFSANLNLSWIFLCAL